MAGLAKAGSWAARLLLLVRGDVCDRRCRPYAVVPAFRMNKGLTKEMQLPDGSHAGCPLVTTNYLSPSDLPPSLSLDRPAVGDRKKSEQSRSLAVCRLATVTYSASTNTPRIATIPPTFSRTVRIRMSKLWARRLATASSTIDSPALPK
jgi:hypothetical protein